MKLLTEELRKKLPPLYATEDANDGDKIVYVKFFTPDSSWTWFVLEGSAIIYGSDGTERTIKLSDVDKVLRSLRDGDNDRTVQSPGGQNEVQVVSEQGQRIVTQQEELGLNKGRTQPQLEGWDIPRQGLCVHSQAGTSEGIQGRPCQTCQPGVGGNDGPLPKERGDCTPQGQQSRKRLAGQSGIDDTIKPHEAARHGEKQSTLQARTAYEVADVIFFGLVDGLEVEMGYFSLSELESVHGPMGLPIERDRYFKPIPLTKVRAYRNWIGQMDTAIPF